MQAAATSPSREVRFTSSPEQPKKRYPATVRYNKHLLKKRLDVEEWLDSQLRLLYKCADDEDYTIEIDLDDVMACENEQQKRALIQKCLVNCHYSADNFIRQLLEKLSDLNQFGGDRSQSSTTGGSNPSSRTF